jgi:hypothetical protein
MITDARSGPAPHPDKSPKDLDLVVQALDEAFMVIDDFDPDRNPARCMRHLRRLLSNADLRVAVRRLAAGLAQPPRPQHKRR